MHIGKILQQKLKDDGKTVVWLANELGCHRTNVYNLFEKYSIDTQLLQRLSVILHFNFFSLYEEEVNHKMDDKQPQL
jgi:plasmid maintenance system antidote protein VapI